MLFDKSDIPRTPPVKRMRVSDAGLSGSGHKVIKFTCPHCGHCTGWIKDEWTLTENRRGQPCPSCNSKSD